MNSCCSPQNQHKNFSNKMKTCYLHGLNVQYICLYDGCIAKSLICSKCLKIHQNHPKQHIKSFFEQDVANYMYAIKNKYNRDILEHTEKTIREQFMSLSKQIQQKLQSIDQILNDKFSQLHKVFEQQQPTEEFLFDYIDNEKMNVIFSTLSKAQNIQWIYQLSEDLLPILQVISVQILSNLGQLHGIVQNSDWSESKTRKSTFRQLHTKNNRDDLEQLWPARFSTKLKHKSIEVEYHGLQAKYTGDQHHEHATVLISQSIAEQAKLSFQIETLQQSSFFNFKPSIIGIGVCFIDGSQRMHFANMHQQYSSAYMITSDGKYYTSKGNNQNKKTNLFFGKGDIIQIWTQALTQQVWFRKKGYAQNRFKIPINSKQYNRLRIFISFSGQKPSKVSLISIKKRQIQAHSEKKQSKQDKQSKQSSLQIKRYERPAEINLY